MTRWTWGALIALALLLGGCGSGHRSVSSASLRPRLLPVTALPAVPVESHMLHFVVVRTFDWGDPVNVVGQGLFLPAKTQPSAAVEELKGAGFKGGSGEELGAGGERGAHVIEGVALLDSEADANKVRDWMHHQDLQQPCYTECIFAPGPVSVPGLPSARVVAQVSKVPSKPGASAAEDEANYLAEFTVGPYLYWTWTHGEVKSEPLFVGAVRLYDAHAKTAS